jgi:S1-C subfamily serine protease
MIWKRGVIGVLSILSFFAATAVSSLACAQETRRIEPSSRSVAERGDLTAAEKSVTALFEEATPSVVYITSVALRRDFFRFNVMEIPSGTGTGFVWDDRGNIVTNFHVIRDASRAEVTLADGSNWEATLVGYAREKDLAVLHIDAPRSRLQSIRIGTSSDLKVGQTVLAIGNPFGFDQTLTTGIVSALGREIDSTDGVPIRDVIQTDAAINPGNSGGPLLDSAGRLIGVNTAIVSPSGGYAGVGFAIPVDTVNWVVPQLIAHGRRKWRGSCRHPTRSPRPPRSGGGRRCHCRRQRGTDPFGRRTRPHPRELQGRRHRDRDREARRPQGEPPCEARRGEVTVFAHVL